MNKNILILGLTGGIASGKSTTAHIFENLGAKVVDADEIAHETIRIGTKAWKKIVGYFGKSILNEDSSINRTELGKIVFADKEKRQELEEIVHPVVIKTIKKKIKELSISNFQFSTVIIDVPLLIEADLTSLVDKLIVVSAWRQTQIRRLKKNGLKGSTAKIRIDSQMPLKEKIKLADYVVRNNGSLKELERQVERIWKDILRKCQMSNK